MGQIFLSYAREDRGFAERIARLLEGAGHSVWWDRHIDSGEEFSAEIEAELDRADVVLVAWSKASVKSRWVRDEAAVGGDTGRLVPVSIDGTLPPMGFRQFHSMDLTGWKGGKREERTAELLRSVERRLNGKSEASAGIVPPETERRRRRPWALVGVRTGAIAALLLVAAIAAIFFVSQPGRKPASQLSVAVLPFAAEASDPQARELASAAHDAVVHTLSQGAFAVRTIDAAPPGDPPPADFLISGQATSASDKFVTTVRMEETAHHVVVFSHQFEATRDALADFPELIGAQVASQLSWTAPLIAMERRHHSDPAIIAALLQSSVAGLESVGTLHDYETTRRLAAQAPNSPLAQNSFAFNTAFALDQIPREERAEAVAAARLADERTMQLAPEYGGAYIPWCLLHSEQRMAQCEDRLRAGMRADPDNSFDNWFLSRLLNNVGRNREAAELASLSLAHDQYMPYKIGHMLRMLEVTGQSGDAADLYAQAIRWWPKMGLLYWNRILGTVERGDFEAVDRLLRDHEREQGSQGALPLLGSAVKARSASGVRAACANQPDDNQPMCMLALAQAGDLDGAFRIADRIFPSRRGRTLADAERIWLDKPDTFPNGVLTGSGAAPLRRDPRYLALAERVGLLEYWRSGRPPDFCRGASPEPVCAQLLKRS